MTGARIESYTWTYHRLQEPERDCINAATTQARVRDPEGNDTVFLFWNSDRLGDDLSGACAPQALLPSAHDCVPSEPHSGSWPQALLCRTLYYDGKDTGTTAGAVKVVDRVWEQSNPPSRHRDVDGTPLLRTVAVTESYPDDDDRFHTVSYQDYDGYGHFAKEVHTGSIGRDARTFETDWLPAVGNWILNEYTRKRTYVGPPRSRLRTRPGLGSGASRVSLFLPKQEARLLSPSGAPARRATLATWRGTVASGHHLASTRAAGWIGARPSG